MLTSLITRIKIGSDGSSEVVVVVLLFKTLPVFWFVGFFCLSFWVFSVNFFVKS